MSQSKEQQQPLNFTSNKDSSISRRKFHTEVPSLKQPVVVAKRPIAHSELDSDSSDLEDYATDRKYPRQQTHNSQSSAWAASMNFWTENTATKSVLTENRGIKSEDNKLRSQNITSDVDNNWSKRQKVAATADDIDNLASDEFLEHALSPYGSQSPDKARLGNFAKPRSSQPPEDEAITPGRANMNPEMSLNTADAISAPSEDDSDDNGTIGTSLLDDTNGDPATPTNQLVFSEVVLKMRTAYIAGHSVAERQSYRWIKNPIDASGPPIREKALTKRGFDDVYIARSESKSTTVWRFCSARNVDKKICIVEDIPVLVATAYCDPTYSNEKQPMTTLLSGYTGFRKEDIEWCLVGMRGQKIPAAKWNPILSQYDEDEAMEDYPSLSNQHEEAISGTNYISPPQTRDNSALHNREYTLQIMSSPHSSPALTESSLPKTNISAQSSTHPQLNANTAAATTTSTPSTTLTDLVHAYTTNTHKNYTTHLNTLTTLLSQASQKHLHLTHRMHSLRAEISDLSTTSTILRGRLTGPRKQSMGQIVDEERAEKEAALAAVGSSVERLGGEIEELRREGARVRGERRGSVRAAAGLRGEVVALLGWVDGLVGEGGDGEEEEEEDDGDGDGGGGTGDEGEGGEEN